MIFGFFVKFSDDERKAFERAIDHYVNLRREELKREDRLSRSILNTLLTRTRARLRRNFRDKRISIGGSDIHFVNDALASYSLYCEQRIAEGANAPFAFDVELIPKMKTRVMDECRDTFMEIQMEFEKRHPGQFLS